MKRYDLEASVVNSYGEGVVLGKPETVKHQKYGYKLQWPVKNAKHTSPLDTVLIHEGRKIVAVIPVAKFRLDGIKSLTLNVR